MYLLQQFQEGQCAARGVVVGYDARHNSKRSWLGGGAHIS